MSKVDEKIEELERRIQELEARPRQYPPVKVEQAKPFDPYRIDFYAEMEH